MKSGRPGGPAAVVIGEGGVAVHEWGGVEIGRPPSVHSAKRLRDFPNDHQPSTVLYLIRE